MANTESVVTFRGFRSKATAARILAGETLSLAYGREIVADIVPRKVRLKHRPTMEEIMAPIRAVAKNANPGPDLIAEQRAKLRR